MRKSEELRSPDSCLNKAKDDELIFVLLARDLAAPGTVRDWINRRVKLGLNKPDDAKIQEAEGWIKAVGLELLKGGRNLRRCELIQKKNRGGLNPEEQQEFDRLQREVSELLDAMHPSDHMIRKTEEKLLELERWLEAGQP